MLDGYLSELRRELASRLPEADVRARLAEAEDHLREHVRYLVALGVDPIKADAQAVRDFGSARGLAKSYATPLPHRRRYAAGLLLGLGLFAWIDRLRVLPWRPTQSLELGFVALLTFVYFRAVFVARRPSGLTLTLVASLAIASLPLYAYGLSHGGPGNACRILLYENLKDCGGLLRPIAESLYEARFLIQGLFAWTCGIDLLASGFGTLVHRLRRRRSPLGA